MPGLFDSLSAATSALRAAQMGLGVTGQNIANINTPGYSRRILALGERRATEFGFPGSGVDIVSIRGARDLFVLARIGREHAGLAKDASVLDGVGLIDAEIGVPGSSVDARLTAFFDSFSGLASDPTSASSRDDVVSQAQSLAQSIGSLSQGFTNHQAAADVSLRDAVTEFNELATRVAGLNGAITRGAGDPEGLIDERSVLLDRMSELADVSVIHRSDGAVDVALNGGRSMVVGETAYAVDLQSAPPSGFATLSLHGADITSSVTNGRIGGLLELRDRVIPRYQAGLDQLAFDLAREVNNLHAAGFDANGAPAGNFFAPLTTVAGAASALAVDPAIVANSQLVAASSDGTAGNNQTALAIAALRDATVMTGGATPLGAWSNLVYDVGSDVSAARAASTTREQVMRQLERLRDQVSGVSLDEEAAHMMRYQRSYEASARYFTTIVDTLDTLMAMVR